MSTSIGQLVARSPLERMRRSERYRRLEAAPDDVAGYETLRSEWALAATKARRQRLAFGGTSVGIGAVLVTVASIRLAADDTTSGERVWAYATVATGVGFSFRGLATMLLPSESESSFAAIEAVQPIRRSHLRVAPTLGGLVLTGRL